MISKGTGTQQKIVSWPLTVHPSPMHWWVLLYLWPNLSVFIKWQSWALLNKIGYQFRRYAGSYLDKSWFSEEYEQAIKAPVRHIQNWGWTTPKTNWTENTNLDLRLKKKKTPVYCFHPDFPIQPQYQQNWGPVPPIWGTLQMTQMTFEFWDHSGRLRNPE